LSPIFVAIDTPDLRRAVLLAEAVRAEAGGVKLGLEFFCANGPVGVREIARLGLPIFLDLKLHDIPNTVAKAVEALAPIAPAVLTVHAAGGRAMLEAAKAAALPTTKIVGVTVLTSLDEGDLGAAGVSGSPADQVRRLADLARDSGLDGIVCSGAEVAAARAAWPEGYFVVPGIRPAPFVPSEVEGRVSTSLDTNGAGGKDDQKRVVTPRQALEDGASMLVIGRPITAADDPARAIATIAAELGNPIEVVQ
jgi:orotidine-5'-phosphate decarboxylase